MFRSLLLIASLGLVCACGPQHIRGTTIPDTPTNREILEMIETYRIAVEERDIQTIGTLVSRRYFENAATTAESKDDYGHEELLKKVLPVLRDNVKQADYKLLVERITVTGNEAAVFVEWDLTFQYQEGGLDGWASGKDKNRLDLVVEDGRWKFLAGL